MQLIIALGINFGALIAIILVLWLIAVRIRDVSFIDAFWAFGMVLLSWASLAQAWPSAPLGKALAGLTTFWGIRLGLHLLLRWNAHGEDPRYKKIMAATMEKKGWSWVQTALLQVFLLQAPLLFIVCLPAQIGILAGAGYISPLGFVGIAIALTGIAFETIGDRQLDQFRKDPASQGKVMDKGLWRYTRHPNYFGDACTWWGIWLLAASAGWWIAAVSVVGPVFLTFTLTKWSGGPLLERGMKKTRPGYDEYVRRTSAFFPLPPKK